MLSFLFLLLMPIHSALSVFSNPKFNEHKIGCVLQYDDNHESVVETPYGWLEGHNYTTGTLAKPFHSTLILGSAYAYNSIEKLRFSRPLTVPSVSLVTTKNYGRHCFPNKDYPGVKEFNEDCLFLNIFMPFDGAMPPPKNGYPVLFFVHGGMYNYGAADDLDLNAIVKNYVERGIVVVTVNYRLGPFGFFQDRTRHLSYNIGLWDLEKAFEYILLSSDKLQLDRSKITLGGVEGGAVLAELLSLKDQIRGNISGLILIGGSVLTPWAISPEVYKSSIKLAQELGINTTNPRDTVFGMKMAHASTLIEKREKTKGLSQDAKNFVEFTPDFDYEFYYYPTLKMTIYKASAIDIYIITTRNEGSIRTSPWKHNYYSVFNERTGIRLEDQSKFSCQNFEAFVRKFFTPSQSDELINGYNCSSSPAATVTPFETYKTFIGDFWFNIPAAFSATLYAELDNNVYVTVVNTSDTGYEKYTGSKEMPSILLNEAYLFSETSPYKLDKTEAENELYKKTQNLIVDSIANFVKKNNSHLHKVDPYSYKTFNFGYHDIENGKEKIETEKAFNEKFIFWRRFFRRHGFKVLSPRIDDGHDLFYFKYYDF